MTPTQFNVYSRENYYEKAFPHVPHSISESQGSTTARLQELEQQEEKSQLESFLLPPCKLLELHTRFQKPASSNQWGHQNGLQNFAKP